MATTRKRAAGLFMAAASIFIVVASLWTGPLGQPNPFCDNTSVVTAQVKASGFEDGDFVVNPDLSTIPETAEAYQRGGGAFNTNGVYTQEQVESYIDADATLKAVIDERLDGRTNVVWIPVYFTVKIDIGDNLGVENGQVINFGTRHSDVGELVWFAVDQTNCQVVQNLIIRAGCANPGSWVAPPCTEVDCTPPPNPCPNGLCPKDPDDDRIIEGTTPLGPGLETTGNESEEQHSSGDVSGNVIDNPVSGDTRSGDTTTDTGDTVQVGDAGDASEENVFNDVTDDTVTVDDTGGTNGATNIAPPD